MGNVEYSASQVGSYDGAAGCEIAGVDAGLLNGESDRARALRAGARVAIPHNIHRHACQTRSLEGVKALKVR